MAGRARLDEEASAQWRQGRSAESVEFHRLRALATQRARQRLTELYPNAYKKLLREERAALGVPLGTNARTVIPARRDGRDDADS